MYQGLPSPKLDRSWSNLEKCNGLLIRFQNLATDVVFKVGVIALPRDQTTTIPNEAYSVAEIPDRYFAEIDVFHQLHCLVVTPLITFQIFSQPISHRILCVWHNIELTTKRRLHSSLSTVHRETQQLTALRTETSRAASRASASPSCALRTSPLCVQCGPGL
jgi:hypothetical protein